VRHLAESWFDPRLALAPSAIHGRGLVARAPISEGEVVMVWGGAVYTRAQLEAGEVPPCSYSFVDDDVLLAAPQDGLDYFVNHSCDPTLWMRDEVTVVARRDVRAGEELTGDYALWESDPAHVLEPCACGSPTCRVRVTGDDWTRRELQERYAGHFLPYIQRRIDTSERQRRHFG
jgi:SET domain-containing protein